jgi:hypothetical protein
VNHQFSRLGRPPRPRGPVPLYVERGGELVTRHPFDANGVHLHAFALPGDPDLLARFCEDTFVIPSGGSERYVPFSPHVLVILAQIDELRSSERPDRFLGAVGETELGLWVPLYDQRRGRLVWAIPYLFVDHPAPLLGGREIYGFPKRLAEFRLASDDTAVDLPELSGFEVRTLSIDRFEADARMVDQRVIAGKRVAARAEVDSSWERATAGLASLRSRFARGELSAKRRVAGRPLRERRLSDALDAAGLLARFLALFDVGQVPVVLLKQFRDAADPRRACYQAIVEVVHEPRGIRGGAVLEDWEIETVDLDGLPLQRELGIVAGIHKPEAAFRLELDFQISLGTVLWEAQR